MSYKHVFYGKISPFSFISRDKQISSTEQERYISTSFLSHNLVSSNPNIGFHIMIYNEKSFSMIFYLSNKKNNHDIDIEKQIEDALGYISFHVDIDDHDLSIKWLGIKKEARGNGYGKYLIL